jgi:nitrite reductase (NADH) large subunit
MNYVIIGNGVAGTTAATNIREHDPEGKITIISDEKYPFYSRIKLIDFLAGKANESDLMVKKEQWYDENKIELVLDDKAVEVDKNSKEIIAHSGRKFAYDKLLLATGANSFVPPIPGADRLGVFTLRRLKDALAIKSYLPDKGKKVIIIGGGVLGLEVGNALQSVGHNITVIEALPRLLPRQMDPQGSEILQKQFEAMDFVFHIGKMTKEITGDEEVSGVELDDGTKIDCDMIIISAGIRAEVTLAEELGLTVDRGVVVKDDLTTDDPDIFCAGDLVNHRGKSYGIWPAAEAQGKIAGINMASRGVEYDGTVPSNILKVAGVDLVSIGEIDAEDNYEAIVRMDTENFIYKKLVLHDQKIIGAILYGDKSNWLKIKNSIESGRNITDLKDKLIRWELEEL